MDFGQCIEIGLPGCLQLSALTGFHQTCSSSWVCARRRLRGESISALLRTGSDGGDGISCLVNRPEVEIYQGGSRT